MRAQQLMTSDVTVPAVRFRLLGGFAVWIGEVVVPDRWRLRKAKTLVKLLALAPGHRLHRDVLAETLWPDRAPEASANNVHQALHAARRALAGAGAPASTIEARRSACYTGDAEPARVRESYPRATYQRLAAVKARLGPDNVFRFNQNIRPETG